MNKKVLNLAIASALCFAPLSHAAQDNAGMHYTSAAEGFYASIRTKFATESEKDKGGGVQNSGSRFGVRGSNDLGNGMKGFYQYEAGVTTDSGGGLSTRVGQVGLEGSFGRVWAGSGWTEGYNMVYGSTDIANNGSGAFVQYPATAGMRMGRANNMIQYRTPDISGFQGALGFNMQADADNNSSRVAPEREAGKSKDDNNLEMWTAAAKYSVQGFTGAFAYSVRPDSQSNVDIKSDRVYPGGTTAMPTGTASAVASVQMTEQNVSKKDDMTAWSARLGYAQDNWSVNGWYGKENKGDFASGYYEDATFFSMAGKVSLGKVQLYAVWEKSETPTKHYRFDDTGNPEIYERDARDNEVTNTVVGISYQLGSRSKVWMDYVAQDDETKTTEEDYVNIGLRHDF